MKLSIVTALYLSSETLDGFYQRITEQARAITDDYEILLVNDGSPDESIEKAIAIYKNDSHVKIIDLSRNFGQHAALLTGLSHARGELIFMIDSDLEEDSSWLSLFYNRMKETGADVVFGQI